MAIRVGINGFGRIGRLVMRAGWDMKGIEFVAINDLFDAQMLAHMYKYDSVHGTLAHKVSAKQNAIVINGKEIPVYAIRNPAELPWKKHAVDVVIEATGVFRKRDQALQHIDPAGAKKVIITAPATDPDITIVMGVNHKEYDPKKHTVISNASCTTNCLAPMVKVLHQHYKVSRGLMTTIHSYTNDQNLLDLAHKKDYRRARAAALSMIPTSTGAAKAIGLVIPELKGKMDGVAVRVPTPNVSLTDLTCAVEKPPKDAEEVVKAFKDAQAGELKGILEVCEEPLVSTDFNHSEPSCIIDAENVRVMDNMIKLFGWYDNEWAFSLRVCELIEMAI